MTSDELGSYWSPLLVHDAPQWSVCRPLQDSEWTSVVENLPLFVTMSLFKNELFSSPFHFSWNRTCNSWSCRYPTHLVFHSRILGTKILNWKPFVKTWTGRSVLWWQDFLFRVRSVVSGVRLSSRQHRGEMILAEDLYIK